MSRVSHARAVVGSDPLPPTLRPALLCASPPPRRVPVRSDVSVASPCLLVRVLPATCSPAQHLTRWPPGPLFLPSRHLSFAVPTVSPYMAPGFRTGALAASLWRPSSQYTRVPFRASPRRTPPLLQALYLPVRRTTDSVGPPACSPRTLRIPRSPTCCVSAREIHLGASSSVLATGTPSLVLST